LTAIFIQLVVTAFKVLIVNSCGL